MNEIIKKSFENGRLILLLGAGASYSSQSIHGNSLPLGDTLAQLLTDEMGYEYHSESLQEVYQAAIEVLGKEKLIEFLQKHFKHTIPSPEYKKLVQLPLTRVYSLNIDDAIERAFQNSVPLESRRILETYRNNDSVKEVDQFFHRLDLIKLNGDINYPNYGFIFSEQEYANGSTSEPLWYSELARDFSRNTILFIGTKLKEPLLWHQIEKYKGRTHREGSKGYVLTPEKLTPIQKLSLESHNLRHIEGTLTDLMDWFSEEYPNGYSPKEIITSQRPELWDILENTSEISLFDKVIPVSISSLSLLEAKEELGIREFYKGFKPTWLDILQQVPALLSRVGKFIDVIISDYKYNDLGSLYLIKGSAGSGKSTALKQVALELSKCLPYPIYYLNEYKHDFLDLIKLLDEKNSDNQYFLVIDRLGFFYRHINEIFQNRNSKVIFIVAENSRILQAKPIDFLQNISKEIDLSEIEYRDVPNILEKIEKYGNWLRLSRMNQEDRINEIFRKSKQQLLIGLLEATSGIGFAEIIKNDYSQVTDESERYLIILAGIATLQNSVSSEITLSRALDYLKLNTDVEKLSNNLIDIVHFNNKNEIRTRHRLYIEALFNEHISLDEIEKAVIAYISAFTVYPFPIITHLNNSESMVYKYLVNAKSLKKLLKNNESRILNIYKRFEKKLEQEGLFLMQYGLALRMHNKHQQAYQLFQQASIAYPDSAHIEHALAVQLFILCFKSNETIANDYLEKAVEILKKLKSLPNDKFFGDQLDMYPIITLSEGHVSVLDHLNRKTEAKVLAQTYYKAISKIPNSEASSRLRETKEKLMKYYLNGTKIMFASNS